MRRMNSGAGIAVWVCAVAALGVVPCAAGEITLQTSFPTQGEATSLIVQDDDGAPVSGATVTATYRPGSSVEHVSEVGTTDEGGRIDWVPEDAGIATVAAQWGEDEKSASTNVSVRFASTPAGGLIIMIFAGLLLVGGSVVRLSRVVKSAG